MNNLLLFTVQKYFLNTYNRTSVPPAPVVSCRVARVPSLAGGYGPSSKTPRGAVVYYYYYYYWYRRRRHRRHYYYYYYVCVYVYTPQFYDDGTGNNNNAVVVVPCRTILPG